MAFASSMLLVGMAFTFHRSLGLATGLLVSFAFFGATKGETLPPAPAHYFNDYAAVTSPQTQKELNERVAKFEKETTNQVVVAVFKQMDSTQSLDAYTLAVANSWKVGQKDKANGVVLFVFLGDRKMRLQVGTGLTGTLTDAVSQRGMMPYLREWFDDAVCQLSELPQRNQNMKRITLLVLVTTTILCLSLSQAGTNDREAQKEIKQIEKARNEALLRGDTSVIDRMTSDDYTFINQRGELRTKAEIVDGFKARTYKY